MFIVAWPSDAAKLRRSGMEINATSTVVATRSTRNMPLLTELGACSGGPSSINMALLSELSGSPVPLKTAKTLLTVRWVLAA
jgi:hypothetical protein